MRKTKLPIFKRNDKAALEKDIEGAENQFAEYIANAQVYARALGLSQILNSLKGLFNGVSGFENSAENNRMLQLISEVKTAEPVDLHEKKSRVQGVGFMATNSTIRNARIEKIVKGALGNARGGV